MADKSVETNIGYLQIPGSRLSYNALAISPDTILTSGESLFCYLLNPDQEIIATWKFHLNGQIYPINSFSHFQNSHLIALKLSSYLEIQAYPLLQAHNQQNLSLCFLTKQNSHHSHCSFQIEASQTTTEYEEELNQLSGVTIYGFEEVEKRSVVVGFCSKRASIELFEQDWIPEIIRYIHLGGVGQQQTKLSFKSTDIYQDYLSILNIPRTMVVKSDKNFAFYNDLLKEQMQDSLKIKKIVKQKDFSQSDSQVELYNCLDYALVQEDQPSTKLLKEVMETLKTVTIKDEKVTESCQYFKRSTSDSFKKWVDKMNQEKLWSRKGPYIFMEVFQGQDISLIQTKDIEPVSGLSTNNFLEIHAPKFKKASPVMFSWCQIQILSLSNQSDFHHCFYASEMFSQFMLLYFPIVTKQLKELQKADKAKKLEQLQYILELHPRAFQDASGKKYYLHVLPEKITIRYTADIKESQEETISVSLGQIELNPLATAYHTKDGSKQFDKIAQSLSIILQKFQFYLGSSFPLQSYGYASSPKKEPKDYTPNFKKFCDKEYQSNKSLLKQKISGKQLTINDKKFAVEVSQQKDTNKQERYKIVAIENCPQLLKEIYGSDHLGTLIEEILEIQKITFKLERGRFGYLMELQSKQFQTPQVISKALENVFRMKKSAVSAKGCFYLEENFLGIEKKPKYFVLKGRIANKQPKGDKLEDLDYEFDNIDLNLYFTLKKFENTFDIAWNLRSQMKVKGIASLPISLDASLSYIGQEYQLAAEMQNMGLKDFLGLEGFKTDNLQLYVNFSTRKVDLKFFIQINETKILINASYSKELVEMFSKAQKFTMKDIEALLQKIVNQQLNTGLDLEFKNVSIRIGWNREKKHIIFTFQIQVVIQAITFTGKIDYSKDKFLLSAGADQISFNILGKRFSLIKPILSLSKAKQLWELKYTGQLSYKSEVESGQSEYSVQTVVAIQRQKGKNEYFLSAAIDVNKEQSIKKCLSVITSVIDNFKMVYISEGYKIKEVTTKPRKYFSVQLNQFKLSGQAVDLDIYCGISPLSLGAQAMFQPIAKSDNPPFVVLKSVSLSAKFGVGPEIIFAVTCELPKFHGINLIGKIIFGVGRIGGALQMKGVIPLSSYIQIGYPVQSSRCTRFQVIFAAGVWNFTIGSRIKISTVEVEGQIGIASGLPTSLRFSVSNLNVVQVVNLIMDIISSVLKVPMKKIQSCSDLLVINQLLFDYDILQLKFQVRFDVRILNNQFKLFLLVDGKAPSFNFSAQIERAININDKVIISSAINRAAGPKFNMELNPTGFQLQLDGHLTFGPIEAKAYVNISTSELTAFIQITLFSVTFKAGVILSPIKKQYAFEFTFGEEQRVKANSHLEGMIKGNQKFSMEEESSNLDFEELKNLRHLQKDICHTFQIQNNRDKEAYRKKEKLMTKVFGNAGSEILKQAQEFILTKEQERQKNLAQLHKELLQRQNYIKYFENIHKEQSYLKNSQYLSCCQNAEKIRQSIKKCQSQEYSLQNNFPQLYEQMQKLNDDIALKSQIQQFNLWNRFKNWVKKVFKAVADFVKKTVQKIIPKIQLFMIGGFVSEVNGKNKFGAYLKLNFKFMEKDYQINKKWGNSFNQQQIEKRAIQEMINVSLQHIRAVYIIPKPLYQTQKSSYKTDDEYYEALESGAIQGVSVQYQNIISCKQLVQDKDVSLIISKATPFNISKESHAQGQHCLCFSKQLDFVFQTQTSSQSFLQQKAPTYNLKLEAFFCNYPIPPQNLLNIRAGYHYSAFVNYINSPSRPLRGFVFSGQSDITKYTYKWPPKIVFDMAFPYYDLQIARFFKCVPTIVNGDQFMRYEFADNSVIAYERGQVYSIRAVKDYNQGNRSSDDLWKQIRVLPRKQLEMD